MKPAQRGFSLIETMISLLVLSTGLLGLAQLQARLSMTSLHLHASTEAYSLGVSSIEHALTLWADGTNGLESTSTTVDTPAIRFETINSIARANRLIDAEVRVRWADPSGQTEIRLVTAAHTGPDVADTRLLLPAY